MTDDVVLCWSKNISIPTYSIGQPNKNPMFLEKRVYQGSSGAVYPHPVVDRVSDEKEDKTYTAVYLENRYLKIMLLPEIGGRVQMALDKTQWLSFCLLQPRDQTRFSGLGRTVDIRRHRIQLAAASPTFDI